MSTVNANAADDVGSLIFRPMERTEADLLLFQRAFAENGSPRTLELLRWQYLQPPDGGLFVELALAPPPSEVVAAIYAVFPVAVRVDGEVVRGAQSLNTLTDVRYRGKGLFIRMAKSGYDRCAKDGVTLVYGFPNGNSAHGFFQKLDWTSLDPLPVMVRPLRLSYVTSRLSRGKLRPPRFLDPPIPVLGGGAPRGCTFRPVTEFGPELDAVWRKFAAGIGVTIERSSEYLRWRMSRPGARYEVIGLYRGAELLGYVCTGISEPDAGGASGTIMELIADPADRHAAHALLAEALRRLSRAGCGAVWAWNFAHSPNHAAFRRAGFLTLPPKYIPGELHMGAKALLPMNDAPLKSRDRWYISLLDSDTH
ncbi:MAG TPA: GNAT family N-acetyltransferase [Thermoanaerobaculia bacterium]|jgi:hypothetical protein